MTALSRFDEVMEQEKKDKEEAMLKAASERENELQKKERYVKAFKRALPDFYQALLKYGNWRTYEYTRKVLFRSKTEQFQAISLLHFTTEDYCYTRSNYYITKEGKYIKDVHKSYPPEYVEISEDELTEEMYNSLDWQKRHSHYTSHTEYDKAVIELRKAMDADDADETAFRYCMLVVKYH